MNTDPKNRTPDDGVFRTLDAIERYLSSSIRRAKATGEPTLAQLQALRRQLRRARRRLLDDRERDIDWRGLLALVVIIGNATRKCLLHFYLHLLLRLSDENRRHHQAAA
jgi:hypothetical protein